MVAVTRPQEGLITRYNRWTLVQQGCVSGKLYSAQALALIVCYEESYFTEGIGSLPRAGLIFV